MLNPFKLYGSYIGGFIGLFIGVFSIGAGFLNEVGLLGFGLLIRCGSGGGLTVCIPLYTNIMIILLTIVGFLIGWGIHSLFRRSN